MIKNPHRCFQILVLSGSTQAEVSGESLLKKLVLLSMMLAHKRNVWAKYYLKNKKTRSSLGSKTVPHIQNRAVYIRNTFTFDTEVRFTSDTHVLLLE